MASRSRFATWIAVAVVFFSIGWFYSNSMANDNENTYYKIDKGLFYLKEVFETVSRNYVDELDAENLSKSAIDGMLKSFDPYTVFFEDPGSQQMRMITRGKYGGVGMEIGIQENRVTVITPMEGSPAKRAGILPGDIILGIEGTPAYEIDLEKASQMLRGKIGTSVNIRIQRPGLDTPIDLTLVREEIILKDVTFSGFLEPGTAYLRLSAFSDKAAREMKEAIRALQSEHKIERVMLDLRGNPGGLLTSAVEIANIFLPPGKLIVSTHGANESESKFFTREKPLLPSQPLVVLIDRSSASAAEIVAGAIQDLDRGVLVGTETFGKGLVQKVYPIDKISQAYLKITTAKYYIPSGRSIQKEDYKKDASVFVDRSDSVEYNQAVNYYTHNGRVVHGGGGVKPDVAVQGEELDRFLQFLLARGLFFQFTVDYLSKHRELNDARQLGRSPEVLREFEKFVNKTHLEFQLEGEKELSQFLSVAKKKHYNADVQDLVEVALQKLRKDKGRQFELHQSLIQELLTEEFAEKIGGIHARIRAELENDEAVIEATKVLQNLPQYQDILAINN